MSAFTPAGYPNFTGATVVTPTVTNHIAVYTNVSGNLSNDLGSAINAGSIQAGLSGTAGSLVSYPASAATGLLSISATSNSGNTTTTLTNASMAQVSTISVPDPGLSGLGTFILNRVSTSFSTGQNITGQVNITGTVASTGSTSGSLVISGGLGLAGSMYIGTSGTVFLLRTNDSTSVTSGSLVISGGIGLSGSLYATNATITNANITNATFGTLSNLNATNITVTTGSIGTLVSTNALVTNETVSSLLVTSGTATSLNVSNILVTSSSIASLLATSSTLSSLLGTSATIGSFAVTGIQYIKSTINSVNSTTGSLIISGGISLAGTLTLPTTTITDSSILSTSQLVMTSNVKTSAYSQLNSKLIGSGFSGASQQGISLSISSDGNAFISGAGSGETPAGASWIFVQTNSVWIQQGSKLTGSGFSGAAGQGYSAAIGNEGTAVIGGEFDNSSIGATWVFVRTNGIWSQQGSKLIGSGFSGAAGEGSSVSISTDGSTMATCGLNDNGGVGSVWIFVRSNGSWSQQGSKLIGSGFSGAQAQCAVSLNTDGSMIAIGGNNDNNGLGATWIFVRSNGSWSQQGSKLVGSGFSGTSIFQGNSISLSKDSSTILIGAHFDNGGLGAAWIFVNSSGTWSQQGSKLVGSGFSGSARQTLSLANNNNGCSISGDTVVLGSGNDNAGVGSTWIFTRTNGVWSQFGSKLIGSGFSGATVQQGYAVSTDSNSNIIVNGQYDNNTTGAVWVFTNVNGGLLTVNAYGGLQVNGGPIIGTSGTIANLQITNATITVASATSLLATSGTISSLTASTGIFSSLNSSAINSTSSEIYANFTNVYAQNGSKIIGSGFSGTSGLSNYVAISQDGSTQVITDPSDNVVGAIWIFIRSGTSFIQQGSKIVGSGYSGSPGFGSISIAQDGSSFVVGGTSDNSNNGAAWIFLRTGTSASNYQWYQLGSKLIGSGFSGASQQGAFVGMSADSLTVISGSLTDGTSLGATWVFVRTAISSSYNATAFYQQGSKLVGSGFSGSSQQGTSSISGDGNTIIVSGSQDNGFGAAWIFTRTANIWTQQGSKLIGSGFSGSPQFGFSNGISQDGNTVIISGNQDNSLLGASWIFVRSANNWSQQGSKLVGSGFSGAAGQGRSVALNTSGTVALIGSSVDNTNSGSLWVFTKSSSVWTQLQSKLIGSGFSGSARIGISVAIDNGLNILSRASTDNSNLGATFYFSEPISDLQVDGSLVVNGTNNVITGSSTFTGPVTIQNGLSTSTVNMNTTSIADNNINSSSAISMSSSTIGTGYTQIGSKLLGLGFSGSTSFGVSASMSLDGSTVIGGGRADFGGVGAIWVFARTGSVYNQFGNKLQGTGYSGASNQGQGQGGTSINADGSMIAIGANQDFGNLGAVWIFIRSGSGYIQQGSKLFGTGYSGTNSSGASVTQYACALSRDSSTLVIGGQGDFGNLGATWIFIRSGSGFVQLGQKLVGSGFSGTNAAGAGVLQGFNTFVSADGSTVSIGATGDFSLAGATWIFVRTGPFGTGYFQQGSKLQGTGAVGATQQGNSVPLTPDGNMLATSGSGDNTNIGATWIFVRSTGNNTWSQQGSKLVGSGYSSSGTVYQGYGSALAGSSTSGTFIVGGYNDNNSQGAAWIFVQSAGAWSQQGSKIIGTNFSNPSGQGTGVGIDSGNNFCIGGYNDYGENFIAQTGALWVYTLNNGSITLNVPGGLFINGPLTLQQQSQPYIITSGYGGAQSILTNTNTEVYIYTPTLNNGNVIRAIGTSSRLQVSLPGLYLINYSVTYVSGFTQGIVSVCGLNGSLNLAILTGTSTMGAQAYGVITSTSTTTYLYPNDYINIYTSQFSGSTQTLYTAGGSANFFNVYKLL